MDDIWNELRQMNYYKFNMKCKYVYTFLRHEENKIKLLHVIFLLIITNYVIEEINVISTKLLLNIFNLEYIVENHINIFQSQVQYPLIC